MKKTFQLGLIFIYGMSYSQEGFVPSKPDHLSESEYRRGELILKNSMEQVANDNYHMVFDDYWNFAIAYMIMGQPKELIYDYLLKAKFTDRNGFCNLVNLYHQRSHGIDSAKFYKLLGTDYKELVHDCPEVSSKDVFNLDEYILKNKYDRELIYRLNALLQADQKFRDDLKSQKLTEQQAVDDLNIKEAEAILSQYGYPGRSIVGAQFDFVIWLVIQHAELSYQEKYLPLIAKTVEGGELGKVPLKMLIDRIYHKKTGHQIFGSQIGVPFADDKTIEEVRSKYKL